MLEMLAEFGRRGRPFRTYTAEQLQQADHLLKRTVEQIALKAREVVVNHLGGFSSALARRLREAADDASADFLFSVMGGVDPEKSFASIVDQVAKQVLGWYRQQHRRRERRLGGRLRNLRPGLN